MSAAITFCKTAAGQDELSSRARHLGVAGRRLLILVNGSRSRAELAQLMGSRVDIDIELGNLEADGLIAPAQTARPATARAAASATAPEVERKGFFSRLLGLGASAPRLEPAQHERMREACFLLHDILGPEADDFLVQLEDCASQEQLERMLERAAHIVGQVRGVDEGALFRKATGIRTG